jgi:trigger factor
MGAGPQPRCHNLNHQPSKQRTLRLNGYIQGGTSFEYDHIEEFSKVGVHDSANLTLLCRNHHGDKTSRRLSREFILSANSNPFNLNEKMTSPWRQFFAGSSVKFIVGSDEYLFDFSETEIDFFSAIQIGSKSMLGFRFDGSGLLLNAVLTNRSGKKILVIEDGEIRAKTEVFDYKVEGPVFTIRSAKSSVELKLQVQDQGLSIVKGFFVRKGISIAVKGGKTLITTEGESGTHSRIASLSGNTSSGTPVGLWVQR